VPIALAQHESEVPNWCPTFRSLTSTVMMRPLPLTFWIYMKICNLRGQDSLSLSLHIYIYINMYTLIFDAQVYCNIQLERPFLSSSPPYMGHKKETRVRHLKRHFNHTDTCSRYFGFSLPHGQIVQVVFSKHRRNDTAVGFLLVFFCLARKDF
jgi:hypothetical protein